MPGGREYKRKHDADTGDDIPWGIKLLKTELGKATPSSLAVPYKFNQVAGPDHAIACNRPFEHNTLPLVLLHEAFGIFNDRCKAAPSERALTFLGELTAEACKWYQDETKRGSAIRSVFEEHLGVRFHQEQVPNTESTTDGNLTAIVMPAAIRECRDHALNLAILNYSRFLYEALIDHRHFFNFNTSFPCILMVDMGSLLGFYGAAWDGERVKVEPLAPGLELATHWKERSARNAIASCFDAFVLAIENIQAHYGSIEAVAQANHAHLKYNFQEARGYPFLTSYSDEGQEITFTYDKRLDEDKLLFSATINLPGSGECIVKFTSQYSKAAHDYLASHGLVPRIWKWIRISADWTAVVMDKSKYQVLFGLWLSKAERDKVQRKVQSIVRTLHEGGFVHGDIRDVNLLIDRASMESDVMVHLIDFDWAGPVGEAKYPMGINCKTVRRPAGVKGGELITEGHDNEMVSSLFTN